MVWGGGGEKKKHWFSEGRKSFGRRGLLKCCGGGRGGRKRIGSFLKGEKVLGKRVI